MASAEERAVDMTDFQALEWDPPSQLVFSAPTETPAEPLDGTMLWAKPVHPGPVLFICNNQRTKAMVSLRVENAF